MRFKSINQPFELIRIFIEFNEAKLMQVAEWQLRKSFFKHNQREAVLCFISHCFFKVCRYEISTGYREENVEKNVYIHTNGNLLNLKRLQCHTFGIL